MTPEQYEQVKAAVLSFLAKGGRLQTGQWGVTHDGETWRPSRRYMGEDLQPHELRCACAIGAFMLETQPTPVWSVLKDVTKREALPCESAARAMGTRASLIMSFACGFDGAASYRGHELAPEEMRAWWHAGAKLREEMKTAGHLRLRFVGFEG